MEVDFQTEILLTAKCFWIFESLNKFSSLTQFGSGWAWLCVHKGGKLDVRELKSRQSINAWNRMWWNSNLGMDVWEHAYYLHYRRPDYIEGFSIQSTGQKYLEGFREIIKKIRIGGTNCKKT
jgi:hypothetical protein